jgi:hypothetical protein
MHLNLNGRGGLEMSNYGRDVLEPVHTGSTEPVVYTQILKTD